MMANRDDIEIEELRDRVLYALMEPTSRLARIFSTPLVRVRDWAEMAYFHETRRMDMKVRDVAELMDVSTSKVSLLARALKENFIRPEIEAELPRRIEFMLWAEPLSLAKIKQVLPDASADEVNAAIQELLAEGRIRRIEQDNNVVFELQIRTDRRVWDSWLARIDGLHNAMRNVADAVYARFFTNEEAAFARTLTFRVRRRDLERLREFYENELFALVQELDAQAEGEGEGEEEDDEVVALSLSLFWAPYDLARRISTTSRSEEDR